LVKYCRPGLTLNSAKSFALVALLLVFTSYSLIAVAAEVTVCFAPPLPDGCDPTDRIIQTLGTAQHQVLVQAYKFTSVPIAKAIIEAHRRGVDVRVILDKSNEKDFYSKSKFFQEAGIPVTIDSAYHIAHNKIIIVDGETVITGSFNFTKSAQEHNAENLVIIRDERIATEYITNWKEHLAHSQVPGTGPTAQGPVEPKPIEGPFLGSTKTLKFGWPGCRGYDSMDPANKIEFTTRQEAESKGYHAYKTCPNSNPAGNSE